MGTTKKRKAASKKLDFSKRLINDNRYLLWFVNVGGMALAFYCVCVEYMGALPWIAGMVSCAWAAHGTICSWYFSMAESDHRDAEGNGITFAAAQANNFQQEEYEDNTWIEPGI